MLPHVVFRLFSIVFLSLLLGTGVAHSEGRRIILNEGADYFGGDFRTVKKVSLDQCKKPVLAIKNVRHSLIIGESHGAFLKKK